MLYVGVDAHKATCHITVMDEAGKILKRKRVPSTPAGVSEALGSFRAPMKAVLEASYNWGPMYDWLGEIADDVTLAHPMEVKAIAHARIKTDRIDSETLAHLLRADLIPPAYAPSKEIRAVKRVLRHRLFFVRIRTMVKNRIHALLAQHALPRPDVSDLFGVAGRRWLQSLTLPEPDASLLTADLEFLGMLDARIATTEALIAHLAQGRCPRPPAQDATGDWRVLRRAHPLQRSMTCTASAAPPTLPAMWAWCPPPMRAATAWCMAI